MRNEILPVQLVVAAFLHQACGGGIERTAQNDPAGQARDGGGGVTSAGLGGRLGTGGAHTGHGAAQGVGGAKRAAPSSLGGAHGATGSAGRGGCAPGATGSTGCYVPPPCGATGGTGCGVPPPCGATGSTGCYESQCGATGSTACYGCGATGSSGSTGSWGSTGGTGGTGGLSSVFTCGSYYVTGAGGRAGGGASGTGGGSAAAADSGSSIASKDGGGSLPAWPAAWVDAGPSTEGIVGTWTGYTENGVPPWDSNIRIVIAAASEASGVQGTMTVGTGAIAPVDPNVGYPPGYSYHSSGPGRTGEVSPGFTYTILKGTVKDGRLRFTIAEMELWRQWCELQTAYPINRNANMFGCLPATTCCSTGPRGCWYRAVQLHRRVDVDCGKLELCVFDSVCACDASRCTARQDARTFTCDFRFEGGEAYGSCTQGGQSGSNTRLFRAE